MLQRRDVSSESREPGFLRTPGRRRVDFQEEAARQGWNFKLRCYNSSPLAVEDVVNGRIDAAAMDDAPAKDAAGKKAVKLVGTFGMGEEESGYAVRQEDKELLEKVNTALTKLMASPEWDALIEKYELNK